MLPRVSVHVGRKLLNKTTNFHKAAKCQFSRLAHNSVYNPLREDFLFNVHKNSKIYGICVVRFNSTAEGPPPNPTPAAPPAAQTQNVVEVNSTVSAVPETDLLSQIPEPPTPIADQITQAIVQVHANGEPTFSSIGLGGYGPVGLVQWYYEWLHISCDMPWWAGIILTSVVVKLLTIPFAIDTYKNNSKMQAVLPQIMEIQTNMSEARSSGNSEQAAYYGYELQEFFKKNKIKIMPLSNFARIAVHFPIFMALRGMGNVPVESLKDGGLWWFKDLTVCDPYYILPLGSSISMFFVAEYAMRSANAVNMNQTVRYLMRGLPLVTFFFAMNFPGVILCHWVVSNFITLAQNQMFQSPKVKQYFNIPLPVQHSPEVLSKLNKKKSFKEAFSDSYTNMKISNKLARHAQADMSQFNEAGKAPVVKTFKYNPRLVKVESKIPNIYSNTAMKK